MAEVKIGALVLAGGKGTRMHSDLPKVLQRILGEPLLKYVYSALKPIFYDNIWTIVGHQADKVKETFPHEAEKAILQSEQLGTGHALQVAWPYLCSAGLDYVVIVNGDTPQLDEGTIQEFLTKTLNSIKTNTPLALSFISLLLKDPGSYGRVFRKEGKVNAIIEAKDDTQTYTTQEYCEVNAGIYCLSIKHIGSLLTKLTNKNKSNEFYITDLVDIAVQESLCVEAFSLPTSAGIMGVNNPKELVESEESICQSIVKKHIDNGIIIRNSDTVRIAPFVTIGKGVDITGPCEIYGSSTIAEGCVIESHCKITSSTIGKGVHIRSYSLFEDASIGVGCLIGPFARLRPGTELHANVHIGNFVEVKKSFVAQGAKINHLSYIGDARIGEKTNIGAGTITCNYDGVHKHTTEIGKNAFIGSNTAFVAPVSIADGALIAAGSTITENVEKDMLAIARARQTNICQKGTKEKKS